MKEENEVSNQRILATITDEEVAEIKSLSEIQDNATLAKDMALSTETKIMAEIADAEASNAIFDWFNKMAEKYGFSKEIQCHVNFEPRTICEGLSTVNEPHPGGPACSPEIVAMMQDGTLCEQCGCHMGKPTGYLRLCEDCGGDQG